MEKLNLNGRIVGPGEPPYNIAEIGSNHNGDMDLAFKLIDAAVDSGADAVKFQSWSKKSLVCKNEYARNTKYADTYRHFGTLEEMCEKYQLTHEQHREAAQYCRKKNITFLSTPFSMDEADLLESLDVCCYKIASMDVNHHPLLAHVARKGKPVILSTGMATLGEIESALDIFRSNGAGPLALLHCIAIYPPRHEDINLRNLETLGKAFDLPVGFSDHSFGVAIPLAAVALGACIIEKHFTLDKNMKGWDHWVSATPEEMKTIVDEGKNIFTALGSSVRSLSVAEQEKKKSFRRRIVLKRNMFKGEKIEMSDLDFKRPGNGIAPSELAYVLGRHVNRDIEEDGELDWKDLS